MRLDSLQTFVTYPGGGGVIPTGINDINVNFKKIYEKIHDYLGYRLRHGLVLYLILPQILICRFIRAKNIYTRRSSKQSSETPVFLMSLP